MGSGFVLRHTAGTHWLTEVIWAALGAPGHHVSRLVSVGLPKMPRSSPLVLLELQYYSLRAETDGERGREGEREMQGGFFFFLASAVVTRHSQLLNEHGPLICAPPSLPFTSPPLPPSPYHPSLWLTWVPLSVPLLHHTWRSTVQ